MIFLCTIMSLKLKSTVFLGKQNNQMGVERADINTEY